MAAISPNFEVRTQKLGYNPKIYMLLEVYAKKNQKPLLRPQKLGGTKVPPPQTSEHGGLKCERKILQNLITLKIYIGTFK